MTLSQIEDSMPNGLHDARLRSFEVNLAEGKLVLHVDADCTSPVHPLAPGEPSDRPARIEISGLCYYRFDPGDVANGYCLESAEMISSSGEIERGSEELPPESWNKIPRDAFVNWIFINGWNSSMFFAGKNAELFWLAGAPNGFNQELGTKN